MRHSILSLLLCFLVGCAILPPEKYLIPNQEIRAKVRIAYALGLNHKLETRVHIAEALLQLEKELHVRIDVLAETEFPVVEAMFSPETPKELIPDLIIESKMNQCDALNPKDGPAILCVFNDEEITAGSNGGRVLGVQAGGQLILANITDRELFMNVMRHEIGHLLGAPHDKEGLMRAFLGKEAVRKIIGFSDGSIKEMREHLKPHLQ